MSPIGFSFVHERKAISAGRAACRNHIVQAANRWKLSTSRGRTWPHPVPKLYGLRHIEQAVFLVKQQRLVSPSLLHVAGYGY